MLAFSWDNSEDDTAEWMLGRKKKKKSVQEAQETKEVAQEKEENPDMKKLFVPVEKVDDDKSWLLDSNNKDFFFSLKSNVPPPQQTTHQQKPTIRIESKPQVSQQKTKNTNDRDKQSAAQKQCNDTKEQTNTASNPEQKCKQRKKKESGAFDQWLLNQRKKRNFSKSFYDFALEEISSCDERGGGKLSKLTQEILNGGWLRPTEVGESVGGETDAEFDETLKELKWMEKEMKELYAQTFQDNIVVQPGQQQQKKQQGQEEKPQIQNKPASKLKPTQAKGSNDSDLFIPQETSQPRLVLRQKQPESGLKSQLKPIPDPHGFRKPRNLETTSDSSDNEVRRVDASHPTTSTKDTSASTDEKASKSEEKGGDTFEMTDILWDSLIFEEDAVEEVRTRTSSTQVNKAELNKLNFRGSDENLDVLKLAFSLQYNNNFDAYNGKGKQPMWRNSLGTQVDGVSDDDVANLKNMSDSISIESDGDKNENDGESKRVENTAYWFVQARELEKETDQRNENIFSDMFDGYKRQDDKQSKEKSNTPKLTTVCEENNVMSIQNVIMKQVTRRKSDDTSKSALEDTSKICANETQKCELVSVSDITNDDNDAGAQCEPSSNTDEELTNASLNNESINKTCSLTEESTTASSSEDSSDTYMTDAAADPSVDDESKTTAVDEKAASPAASEEPTMLKWRIINPCINHIKKKSSSDEAEQPPPKEQDHNHDHASGGACCSTRYNDQLSCLKIDDGRVMSPVFIDTKGKEVYERTPSYYAMLEKNKVNLNKPLENKVIEVKEAVVKKAVENENNDDDQVEVRKKEKSTESRKEKDFTEKDDIGETAIDECDENIESADVDDPISELVKTMDRTTNTEPTEQMIKLKKIVHAELVERERKQKKHRNKGSLDGDQEQQLAQLCSQDLTDTLTSLFPHYFQPDGRRKDDVRSKRKKKKKKDKEEVDGQNAVQAKTVKDKSDCSSFDNISLAEEQEKVRRRKPVVAGSTDKESVRKKVIALEQTIASDEHMILQSDSTRWTINQTPKKKPLDQEINNYIEKQSSSIRKSGVWDGRRSSVSSTENNIWLAKSTAKTVEYQIAQPDHMKDTKETTNTKTISRSRRSSESSSKNNSNVNISNNNPSKSGKKERPLSGILKPSPQKSPKARSPSKILEGDEANQSENDLIDVLFLFHDKREEDHARRSISRERSRTNTSTSLSKSTSKCEGGDVLMYDVSDGEDNVFIPQKEHPREGNNAMAFPSSNDPPTQASNKGVRTVDSPSRMRNNTYTVDKGVDEADGRGKKNPVEANVVIVQRDQEHQEEVEPIRRSAGRLSWGYVEDVGCSSNSTTISMSASLSSLTGGSIEEEVEEEELRCGKEQGSQLTTPHKGKLSKRFSFGDFDAEDGKTTLLRRMKNYFEKKHPNHRDSPEYLCKHGIVAKKRNPVVRSNSYHGRPSSSTPPPLQKREGKKLKHILKGNNTVHVDDTDPMNTPQKVHPASFKNNSSKRDNLEMIISSEPPRYVKAPTKGNLFSSKPGRSIRRPYSEFRPVDDFIVMESPPSRTHSHPRKMEDTEIYPETMEEARGDPNLYFKNQTHQDMRKNNNQNNDISNNNNNNNNDKVVRKRDGVPARQETINEKKTRHLLKLREEDTNVKPTHSKDQKKKKHFFKGKSNTESKHKDNCDATVARYEVKYEPSPNKGKAVFRSSSYVGDTRYGSERLWPEHEGRAPSESPNRNGSQLKRNTNYVDSKNKKVYLPLAPKKTKGQIFVEECNKLLPNRHGRERKGRHDRTNSCTI